MILQHERLLLDPNDPGVWHIKNPENVILGVLYECVIPGVIGLSVGFAFTFICSSLGLCDLGGKGLFIAIPLALFCSYPLFRVNLAPRDVLVCPTRKLVTVLQKRRSWRIHEVEAVKVWKLPYWSLIRIREKRSKLKVADILFFKDPERARAFLHEFSLLDKPAS